MYSNRMSGLHAAHVALQAYMGVEEAIRALDSEWYSDNLSGSMSASELAWLLKERGLPAIAWVLPPAELLPMARGAADGGYIVLLRMHPSVPVEEQRWGIYWGRGSRDEHVAECVGPEGGLPVTGTLESILTGEMVVVERDAGRYIQIVAYRGRQRR